MATFVSRTHRELDSQHLWHGNLQHHGLDQRPPLEIVRADGCWVYDSEGRSYLDAMAGLWCVNVGYGRSEIVNTFVASVRALARSTGKAAPGLPERSLGRPAELPFPGT